MENIYLLSDVLHGFAMILIFTSKTILIYKKQTNKQTKL